MDIPVPATKKKSAVTKVTALFLFSSLSNSFSLLCLRFSFRVRIRTRAKKSTKRSGFFFFPRTGVIGTLLLCAYMGGAIATHLEHGQSIMAPCIIQAFLWAVAIYRFPELTNRLRNK
ncbi:MAG: DoxX family protein [Flavobacteriia bacterium]|nr:DoxX family protein [Flavobacteriia bacterium]